MASLFTLSRHLVRDVLADELPPQHHHRLWQALCQHASSLLHARARPVLPAHHQLSQQRWLLEKGPHRC